MAPAQTESPSAAAALAAELSGAITGEVRTDKLARVLYATDASIYEITPDVVVLPKTVDDVIATVRLCGKHNVPLTARGAGTGLSGGAVNRGVQLDCSRYLNRVLHVDRARRIAVVEPGVVLDELNAVLKPHNLHFPPDVATSSRATIGGMIANNSAGAHSIIHGRTSDHVLAVDVVLADGSLVRWGAGPSEPGAQRRASECEAVLREILATHADEIAARFPKVMRSNGGYALDRLRELGPDGSAVSPGGGRLNVETLFCGSEGTLGVIVGAVLNLIPLPRLKGMCVVHFDGVVAACNAVRQALTHQPAAVELVDKFILDATKDNPAMERKRGFLAGEPGAVLIVEFYEEDAAALERRLAALAADFRGRGFGYAWPILTDGPRQQDVWDVRKGGTGLLMSRPGEVQPYDFVDDTAVDPGKLGEYMQRFGEILREEGVPLAGYYGHASVGLLHVRPALNLRRREDIGRLRRIADRVSTLVAEFGGAMTGEHGDGIVRSCWLERTYGPRLMEAFRRIKQTFDPQGILNPGKIIDPLPMDGTLRYGEGYETQQPLTVLDFGAYGGMAGLVDMCSGLGQCRSRLVGTMCPSYMATGDETHTTRARANALRAALSNKGLLDGLSDPALAEAMDLCLACKACKTECPTGTDMARLKAEWLHHRNERLGVPRRSRLIAASVNQAAWGCRLAPLSNWLMQSRPLRLLMEYWAGLDRRVPPPRFARQTFRQWFAARSEPERQRGVAGSEPGAQRRASASLASLDAGPGARRCAPGSEAERGTMAPAVGSGGPTLRPVVYFVDTWTNFYQPQVGIATVRVLEALGCEVIVPPTVCCGRPLISKGLLRDAQRLAEANVAALGPYAARGLPIVGTEPSCVSVLLDELPQLVRDDPARLAAARQIAACAMNIETFVARQLAERPEALRFNGAPAATADPNRDHEGAYDSNRDREGAAGREERGPARVSPLPHGRGSDRPLLLYHGHCHQKALMGTADALAVLMAATAGRAAEINSGCCGMAGAFGHEVEHYDVARAVGEQRLFPAVRARGEAEIAVSGFSCRHHIAHHTGVRPRHVIEYLADALG